jgi:hypothetical protein
VVTNTFGVGEIISKFVLIHLYSLAFLFYPMFIVIILIPISFLLFAMGATFLLKQLYFEKGKVSIQVHKSILKSSKLKKIITMTIFVLIILAQLLFSYPSYVSGSYDGIYEPINPSNSAYVVGVLLENSTGYNLLIGTTIDYPPPPQVWTKSMAMEQLLSSYKNVITGYPSEVEVSNVGRVLEYEGVQNVVVNNESGIFGSMISKLKSEQGLKLIYHQGYIYLYRNLDFHQIIESKGVWLDYNYPYSNFVLDGQNSSLVSIPYYGESIPLNYVGGVIGVNVSVTDVLALMSHNYSINLLGLAGSYAANPSSLGQTWGYSISYYPIGATGISINGENSQTLMERVNPGEYDVLVGGIGGAYFGSLQISNGSRVGNLSANFNQQSEQLEWINAGNISTNGELYFKNVEGLYITSIEIVPTGQYNNLRESAIKFANSINIISAENHFTNLFVNATTILTNRTNLYYPNIVEHNGNTWPEAVTEIVLPSEGTFGVPTNTISSSSEVLNNYYVNTIYYYVVLGTNYSFVKAGAVNDSIVWEINLATLVPLLIAVTLFLKRRTFSLEQ